MTTPAEPGKPGSVCDQCSSSDAKPKAPQDWRLRHVKRRYAKLLEILERRLGEPELSEILRELGAHCASTMSLLKQNKDDVDGFIRDFKKHMNEDITYDRQKGIITVVSPEREECFCPLISPDTSAKVCDCSLGWQRHVYETLLGKKVEVELKESVLRGGKRCIFEVRVLQ